MLDAELVLEGGVQALTLLNHIDKLVRNSRQQGENKQIADIMEQLPSAAFQLAGQLEAKARDLKSALTNKDVDLTKTLDQLQVETSRLLHWPTYNLLKQFNGSVHSICSELSILADDAVAIAHCSGNQKLISLSYSDSKEYKTGLRRLADDSSKPLGERIEFLIQQAESFRAAFGDLKRN